LGFFCFATCSPAAGAPVLSEFLRAMPVSLKPVERLSVAVESA
jgi:hypothetical protein